MSKYDSESIVRSLEVFLQGIPPQQVASVALRVEDQRGGFWEFCAEQQRINSSHEQNYQDCKSEVQYQFSAPDLARDT